jgi:hypothetical protein
MFGDISTGRLFYADPSDMIASNDGIRTTPRPRMNFR